MSLEAVEAFRARVAQDAGLQALCAQAAHAGEPGRVVAAAAGLGLQFTPEELQAALGSSALSDQELEMVAGGSKDAPYPRPVSQHSDATKIMTLGWKPPLY